METEKRVFEIVAEVLEINVDQLSESSSIGDFPKWDSLGHMAVLSAIQEEFDFDLDAEEMLDIEDLKDIVNVVKSKIA